MAVRILLRATLVFILLAGLLARPAQPALAERVSSVSFPGLLLPTERDGVLTGNAHFHITLELSNARIQQRANERRAQIQDALISVLFTAMGDRIIVNGGIENGAELRRRLDERVERILGRGTVRRVLVYSNPQKP